jgi:hypothetical protein
MRSGACRAAVALSIVLAAAAVEGCGGLFQRQHEYEEELYLDIDGSATVVVNASMASLVALHGAALDPRPDAPPDRDAVRALFSAPGVEVETPTFFRRNGRRFVHVTVDVERLAQLERLRPFAWSRYSFAREGEAFVFRQVVGRPRGPGTGAEGWTGEETVAFRMHVPSKVIFENATSNVQRGNIVTWEQPLAERMAGTPLELRVDMAPDSILYTTLLLFGATVVAAALVFVSVIAWVVRRGRRANAEDARPAGG